MKGFRQSGVSLIEVLVSVLILSVGLLGIAAMQATALRNGQSSLERSQAVIQSYAILDAIRADRSNATAYSTGSMRCAAVAPASDASATTALAQAQVNDWISALKAAMGTSTDTTTCGQVACVVNATTNGSTCTVTVQWDDSRGKGLGGAAGSSTQQTVTVASL
ncbi:MAG: type IV pilus modification protein PilV [Thermomonas sp.]|uniref:type IV pilus modification protein PilV n=1 Tax=Thermomonas sp. TaxID=1971895 RepID=UPI0039E6E868